MTKRTTGKANEVVTPAPDEETPTKVVPNVEGEMAENGEVIVATTEEVVDVGTDDGGKAVENPNMLRNISPVVPAPASLTGLPRGGETTEELQTLPNTPVENSGIPSNISPAAGRKHGLQVGEQVDLATANRMSAQQTKELNEPDRPVTLGEFRQLRRRGKSVV